MPIDPTTGLDPQYQDPQYQQGWAPAPKKKTAAQVVNDWINGASLPDPLSAATWTPGAEAPRINIADAFGHVAGGLGRAADLATGQAAPNDDLGNFILSTTPSAQPGPWEQELGNVGKGLPRGMAQGLMMSNPVTAPVGYADAFLSGAAPNNSIMSGLVNAGTMGVASKVIPAAGNWAAKKFVSSMYPAAEKIAAQPMNQYAKTIGDLFANKVPVSKIGEVAARTLGSVGAGTGVFEASRQAQNLIGGKGFSVPTLPEIGGNVLQNAAFAVPEFAAGMREQSGPLSTELGFKADALRESNAKYDAQRGNRLAELHKGILDQIAQGQTPDLSGLSQEYSEAVEQRARNLVTTKSPEMVMTSAANAANRGELSDQQLGDVISAIMGRFQARAEASTAGSLDISATALNQLYEGGHLQRPDNAFLKQNMPETLTAALGDDRLAMINLINRVDDWTQQHVPEARQALLASPKRGGILAPRMDIMAEAALDQQYFGNSAKLYRFMQGKVGPRGEPLADALNERHVATIRATGDMQGTATHEWDQYANWRDMVNQAANTYDPNTNSWQYQPTYRVHEIDPATGEGKYTEVKGDGQTHSLEDLVAGEPKGLQGWEYSLQAHAKRVTRGRGGKSTKEVDIGPTTTAAGDMFQLLADREARDAWANEEEDPATAGEQLAAEVKGRAETTLPEPKFDDEGNPVAPTTAEDVAKGQQSQAEQVLASGTHEASDAAMVLVDTVKNTDNDTLWRKVGMQMFGEKVSADKVPLFKQALTAWFEHLLDPSGAGQLTQGSVDFVRAKLGLKEGEQVSKPRLVGKTPREQASHLLGDYFKNVTMSDKQEALLSLLDGHPQLQEYLRKVGQGGGMSKTAQAGQPLPDNAIVTQHDMDGNRATQVTIPPTEANSRPPFDGSLEDARAAGYDVSNIPSDLEAGQHTIGEINASRNISNFRLPGATISEGRLGDPTGLFYGSKVTATATTKPGRFRQQELPTDGDKVLTIRHRNFENEGDGSNAPLTEMLNYKVLSVDRDLFDLVKDKEGSEQPLDSDLLAAIQLKRDGFDVVHMVDPYDASNVVSIDMRHVTEQQMTDQLISQLHPKGSYHMEEFAPELYSVRDPNETRPVGKFNATRPLNGLMSGQAGGHAMVAAGFTNPAIDVARIFRGWGSRSGYDPVFCDELAKLAVRMVKAFPEVGAVGRFTGLEGAGLNDAVAKTFGQIQTWGLNMNTAKGITALVNFDAVPKGEVDRAASTFRFLQVLAHELTHAYTNRDPAAGASPFMRQRAEKYQVMLNLFGNIGPEMSTTLLNKVMFEILVPEQFRGDASQAVANTPTEAVSRLMEYIAVGAFTRGTGLPHTTADRFSDAIQHVPDEVYNFMQMAYRDINDFVNPMKDYFSHRMHAAVELRDAEGNTPELTDKYNEDVKNSATTSLVLDPLLKHANAFLGDAPKRAEYQMLAQNVLNGLVASGSRSWHDPVVVFKAAGQGKEAVAELAKMHNFSFTQADVDRSAEIAHETQTALFGSEDPVVVDYNKRALGTTTPLWSKWIGSFYQHMTKYEKLDVSVSADVSRTVQGLSPAYDRISRQIRSAFMTKDQDGRVIVDPDHPIQAIIRGKIPEAAAARVAISDICRRGNFDKEAQITENEDGSVEPSDYARARLAKFKPEVQQGILEVVKGLLTGHQEAAKLQYASFVERAAWQVSKIAQRADKTMRSDKAAQFGQDIIMAATETAQANKSLKDAQERGDDITPYQATAMQAQARYNALYQGLDPDMQAKIEPFLFENAKSAFGDAGAIGRLVALNDLFTARASFHTTESRPGRFFILSKDADGHQNYNSADSKATMKIVIRQLAGQGHHDFTFIDKWNKQAREGDYNVPDQVVENFAEVEKKSWQQFMDQVKTKMDPDDWNALKEDNGIYSPGVASSRQMLGKAVQKFMLPQELTRGRENLDSWDAFDNYSTRLAATISRQSLRNHIDLLLNDPTVRSQGEFQDTVNNAVKVMLTPTHDQFAALKAGMTAFFMGLPNVTAPIIEATQQIATVQPYLIWNGVKSKEGVISSFERIGRGVTNVGNLAHLQRTFEGRSQLKIAEQLEKSNPSGMTKDQSLMLYYQRALDDNVLRKGIAQQLIHGEDGEFAAQQAMGNGGAVPKGKMDQLKSRVYWVSKAMMLPYTYTTEFNNNVAFHASVDLLYDEGYRGQDLYSRAQNLLNQATFGGGKQNEVGYIRSLPEVFSNPALQSAAKMTLLLQRYTLGIMTMFKDMTGDIVDRAGTLQPQQRIQAVKGLSYALGTMAALGGAVAVPGFGIAATMLEKMFHYDVKDQFRRFWYELVHGITDSEPIATGLANVAVNGISNQFFGMDISSRIGIKDMLGFNAYDGFNASDLLGIPYSLGQGIVDATGFASQHEYVRAFRSIAPPSLQKMTDLMAGTAKWGQPGEYGASGLQLSTTPYENVLLGLGVTPGRYRTYKDLSHSLKIANDNAMVNRNRQLDDVAQAMNRGNTQPTFDWVRQAVSQSPGLPMSVPARAVVDRVIQNTNQQDLLAGGLTGNDAQRMAIAKSYGQIPRRSEMDELVQRERLNAQLGYLSGQPATSRQIDRAMMIDALVRSQGLDREAAARLATNLGF